MRIDPADGGPLVGVRRNMLGVRPTDPVPTHPGQRFDVPAALPDDPVLPGANAGLSVTTAPGTLKPMRDEAVWRIESDGVAAVLTAVPDRPPQHVLEPTRPIALKDYQAMLAGTRTLWARAT